MIHIPRTHDDFLDFATADLIALISQEDSEAQKYFKANGHVQKFPFACYKNDEIKNQLKAIFKGKCGYCDSSMLHITFGDVDHFRPKSVYWWMGCKWYNLILACDRCNRSGKKAHFPLKNDQPTQLEPGDDPAHERFKDEETNWRLLINPCIDQPETFFQYDYQANILPKNSLTQHQESMADKSIKIYGLQRPDLIAERRKHLILLLAQIDSTKNAIEDFKNAYSYTISVKAFFENRLRDEIDKLLFYVKSDRQFLGQTRQILGLFFAKNNLNVNL